AVWHGPDGLRGIADRVHGRATTLAAGLRAGGVEVVHDTYFDTVLARVPGRAEAVVATAATLGVNLGRVDADHVRIACDEVTTHAHLELVWKAFGASGVEPRAGSAFPAELSRTTEFLTHPVFAVHRSETA